MLSSVASRDLQDASDGGWRDVIEVKNEIEEEEIPALYH
jgi:hypothetical protein